MKNAASWDSYYENHKLSYSNIILHWQYVLAIIFRMPKKVLEIGCGPADHSIFVKKVLPFSDIYLLDQDDKLLKRIKHAYKDKVKQTFNIDLLDSKALNAAKMPIFDVVISQGLMEHFNDQNFLKILENFKGKTKMMIFSIPSEQYPTKDYGDEILRSPSQIKKLIKKVKNVSFVVKNYADIGMKTKLLAIKNRKLNLFKALSYLIQGSNHLWVEINYENSL